MIQNVPPFAVVASKAVLQLKRATGIELSNVCLDAVSEVVGMDTFAPPIPGLLFHSAAGKVQPRFVEPRTALVYSAHPDHYGRMVCELAERVFQLAF
jgi:hypothetical protein